MKAVLSNRIFMEVNATMQSKLDDELTYAIPPRNPLDPPFIIKNMGIVRKGLVTLPSGRTDLIPEDYEIVDKRKISTIDPFDFKFTLRPS